MVREVGEYLTKKAIPAHFRPERTPSEQELTPEWLGEWGRAQLSGAQE